ncbi:hypothetical protein DOTSEDRAFT_33939 [Dothistroma septosporum NZE10]|uniref:Uncharacterized protein n=1 Tax=Dothistroma septosporum (strain NZE10 / CBS 128990) TaxID=675120 RepID=N1PSN6_DOTSN|nr:hypothetical protein DOTSEDRAFT_33939 [Dothistroma septosporum NZE10]
MADLHYADADEDADADADADEDADADTDADVDAGLSRAHGAFALECGALCSSLSPAQPRESSTRHPFRFNNTRPRQRHCTAAHVPQPAGRRSTTSLQPAQCTCTGQELPSTCARISVSTTTNLHALHLRNTRDQTQRNHSPSIPSIPAAVGACISYVLRVQRDEHLTHSSSSRGRRQSRVRVLMWLMAHSALDRPDPMHAHSMVLFLSL